MLLLLIISPLFSRPVDPEKSITFRGLAPEFVILQYSMILLSLPFPVLEPAKVTIPSAELLTEPLMLQY